MAEIAAQFEPKWVSPPGDTILDLLEERGWPQTEFAERTGYTAKHVSLLINGKASITEDTAFRLERVLGGTAGFWLSREAKYREIIARQSEQASLRSQSHWLRELPLAHMIKYEWVSKAADKTTQVSECLSFFGVASVDAWRNKYAEPLALAAFKSSPRYRKNVPAIAAWLRQGEKAAMNLDCERFDRGGFKAELKNLRNLTNESDPALFVAGLTEACARVGVAVVFEPAPPGCPVTGATKWLTNGKALLMLSLRYKSNDHLWFAFFHEAGHILLHGKKMLFLEFAGALDGKNEEEADRFASDFLISPGDAAALPFLAHTAASVTAFARKIGVAPGIVVGRMQHDGLLPMNYLNKLKVRYRWQEG